MFKMIEDLCIFVRVDIKNLSFVTHLIKMSRMSEILEYEYYT